MKFSISYMKFSIHILYIWNFHIWKNNIYEYYVLISYIKYLISYIKYLISYIKFKIAYIKFKIAYEITYFICEIETSYMKCYMKFP